MAFQDDVFADLEAELKRTRTMLERIPEEHFDWKPHDKSWSLVELSTHLATVPWWIVSTVDTEEVDLQQDFGERPTFAKRDDVLAAFDKNAADARDRVSGATEEHLRGAWTLKSGGHVIFSRPRFQVIRDFGLNHMGHHRGQLSVYLRLLDQPLPPIFGPTADEQMA